MSSFIADCPRGHKGNFVTVGDYHVCFCNMRVPVFQTVIDYREKQFDAEYEAQVREKEIQGRVEERVFETQTAIETQAEARASAYDDRLREVDPEYDATIRSIVSED